MTKTIYSLLIEPYLVSAPSWGLFYWGIFMRTLGLGRDGRGGVMLVGGRGRRRGKPSQSRSSGS